MTDAARDLLGDGFSHGYYRNAASEFIQIAEAAVADAIKNQPSAKKLHREWQWADKSGNSIEVADLTESEAKDALCKCMKVLMKVYGEADKTRRTLYDFWGYNF